MLLEIAALCVAVAVARRICREPKKGLLDSPPPEPCEDSAPARRPDCGDEGDKKYIELSTQNTAAMVHSCWMTRVN